MQQRGLRGARGDPGGAVLAQGTLTISTPYPAVPFGRSPAEQQADLTRARFEITVPTADAIVLFDGVKMTQTGLRRVFMTPIAASITRSTSRRRTPMRCP